LSLSIAQISFARVGRAAPFAISLAAAARNGCQTGDVEQ
jgi:hypothetical protein